MNYPGQLCLFCFQCFDPVEEDEHSHPHFCSVQCALAAEDERQHHQSAKLDRLVKRWALQGLSDRAIGRLIQMYWKDGALAAEVAAERLVQAARLAADEILTVFWPPAA